MIAPDMATMLSFVFTDAPIAAPLLQTLLDETRRRHLQRGDHRRRHLDLRHAAGVRDRRRRSGAPKISKANDPRLKGFRKAFEMVLARSRRAGGARRRRRAQAGRDRGRGRGVEEVRAPDRDVDRQFAAGEDRDRRRGRQLGPRGDGGRQGRRARRPRQALDLVRRHPRRPQGRARSRLRRGQGLGGDEEPEDRAQGRSSGSAAARTAC